MARKRSSKASEENLPLFCVKTQISFVRNVSGAPFPLRMAPQAAKALGKQLAAWVAKFVARAEDLTEDALLADAGEVVYGLTPRKERGPGYRLLRLMSSDGLVVWCELMSANHLTFSVCGDFLDFGARTEALRHFVDALAEPVGFAYDERLGYLTAQTSLVGTGLRIRSWMHLGGLAHFGYLRELCNAAEAKGTYVELEHPDNPPPGSLLILFNRFSLGARAEEIAERHRAFLLRVSEQETEARWRLIRDEPFVFLDVLNRAKATLKCATLMSEAEALDLLSDLRIGLTSGMITARRVNPLVPGWFDDVREGVFFNKHGRLLRRRLPLPHDVDTFTPWRDDALRAAWMRPLSSFTFSKELVEWAAEQ